MDEPWNDLANFAAIGTFLALWHDYDATALDSLASIGWEYDDGSALATFVDVTLMTGLTSILIGGGLVAAARLEQAVLQAKQMQV